MKMILSEYGSNWLAMDGNNAIIQPHRLLKTTLVLLMVAVLTGVSLIRGFTQLALRRDVAKDWSQLSGAAVNQPWAMLYEDILL